MLIAITACCTAPRRYCCNCMLYPATLAFAGSGTCQPTAAAQMKGLSQGLFIKGQGMRFLSIYSHAGSGAQQGDSSRPTYPSMGQPPHAPSHDSPHGQSHASSHGPQHGQPGDGSTTGGPYASHPAPGFGSQPSEQCVGAACVSNDRSACFFCVTAGAWHVAAVQARAELLFTKHKLSGLHKAQTYFQCCCPEQLPIASGLCLPRCMYAEACASQQLAPQAASPCCSM